MRGRGRERACGPAVLSHRRGGCILSCLAVAVVVSSESVSKKLCFTSNKEMKRKKKKNTTAQETSISWDCFPRRTFPFFASRLSFPPWSSSSWFWPSPRRGCPLVPRRRRPVLGLGRRLPLPPPFLILIFVCVGV